MAQYKGKNLITDGLSGKLSGLSFRQRNGKTILASVGSRSTSPSTDELERQNRFKLAAAWAKVNQTEPRYINAANAGKTAFNVAMADYLRQPVAVGLTINNGNLTFGTDNPIPVESANVTIMASNGTQLEAGAATAQNGTWVYTMTTAPTGTVVIAITLTDFPGNVNETTIEVNL